MARLPRLTLPGYAHHLVQWGNNRQPIFLTAADYQMMWQLLHDNGRKFGVAIHAYVLMDNHFHLLATPSTADGLPQLMQAIGRRYVRYFNDRLGRTGTLWDGRYRGAVMDSDAYLLACMVFIDLNPVRAGQVADAGSYAWSSYGHHAGLRPDALLTPHALYWSLGNTPFAREAAYAALVQGGTTVGLHGALANSVRDSWPLGSEDFTKSLQRLTDRRMVKSKAGRPLRLSS